MALSELKYRVTECLKGIDDRDEIMLNNWLKEFTSIMVDADFPRSIVDEIERKSQGIINLNLPNHIKKGEKIDRMIISELVSKLDLGKSALIQAKREPSIVIFVGLRGVEKATTCAKYARCHLKKGFRPVLVCDGSSYDAFVRLKKAAKDHIPVYESYTTYPEKNSVQGKHDLIIVHTSDRYTEHSTLFEETHKLAKAMNPDVVVLVIDSFIGQSAYDQSQAFKQSFSNGVVIVTNIYNNSKACGAISAVATAKCPMILAEAYEDDEFEAFEANTFVRRIFQWDSPVYGFDRYPLRKMYDRHIRESRGLYDHVMKINHEKVNKHLKIMDCLTNAELDKTNVKNISQKRIVQIAQESKVDVKEVVSVFIEFNEEVKSFLKNRARHVAKSLQMTY